MVVTCFWENLAEFMLKSKWEKQGLKDLQKFMTILKNTKLKYSMCNKQRKSTKYLNFALWSKKVLIEEPNQMSICGVDVYFLFFLLIRNNNIVYTDKKREKDEGSPHRIQESDQNII